MYKLLIIGKNSFIGSSLKNYLLKRNNFEILSFEEIINKKSSFFLQFTHVINTAIHKNYVKKKYNKIYDLDRKFIYKFKKINFIYIYLNSRKIYFQKKN